MNRIEKLLAKPKQIELDGEKLDIYPLTVANLDIILDMEKEDKRAIAMEKIVKITLKRAIPEATDEQLDGVSLEYFVTIMDAIIEVNGLDDKSTAIKERLAQQRAIKG